MQNSVPSFSSSFFVVSFKSVFSSFCHTIDEWLFSFVSFSLRVAITRAEKKFILHSIVSMEFEFYKMCPKTEHRDTLIALVINTLHTRPACYTHRARNSPMTNCYLVHNATTPSLFLFISTVGNCVRNDSNSIVNDLKMVSVFHQKCNTHNQKKKHQMVFNRWGCARLLSDVKISNGIINCEKNDKIRAFIVGTKRTKRKEEKRQWRRERRNKHWSVTVSLWTVSITFDENDWISWLLFFVKGKKLLHPYLCIEFFRGVRDRIKNLKDLSQSFGYPCIDRSVRLAYHNNENGSAAEEDRSRCLDLFLFIYVINPSDNVVTFHNSNHWCTSRRQQEQQ